MYTHTHTCVCVCVWYVCMYGWMDVRMYVCVYGMYGCMDVWIYGCAFMLERIQAWPSSTCARESVF